MTFICLSPRICQRTAALGAAVAALALGTATSADAAIPRAERQALLALYDATQGDQWTDRAGWRGPAGSECAWSGVRCDEDQRHVVALRLPNNQLQGRLPRLDALRELRELRLSLNYLHGPLPPLKALRRLESIKANNNLLSGPLPALATLPRLQRLDLANNRLSGPLPDWRRLPALREVDLSNNRLSATPTPPGALAHLRRVDLAFNRGASDVPVAAVPAPTPTSKWTSSAASAPWPLPDTPSAREY